MFYPAYCDNNCKGCEKNKCGWCIWKDRATEYYKTEAFTISTAESEQLNNKVIGNGYKIFDGTKK